MAVTNPDPTVDTVSLLEAPESTVKLSPRAATLMVCGFMNESIAPNEELILTVLAVSLKAKSIFVPPTKEVLRAGYVSSELVLIVTVLAVSLKAKSIFVPPTNSVFSCG